MNSSGGGKGPWDNIGGGDKNNTSPSSDGGSNSPWGGGNKGGGSGGGRGDDPFDPKELEELIRKSQDKIKRLIPGRGNNGKNDGYKGLLLIILIALGIWAATGFYRVMPSEQGVELRFGEFKRITTAGLHYHFPYPIETVLTPNITKENLETIGFRKTSGSDGDVRNIPEESIMLTGDENIVDIDFTVVWDIKNAADYLFNMRAPDETVKVAAESAMREVIGQTPIQMALTEGKQDIQNKAKTRLQELLDNFGSGIRIKRLELQRVDPPAQVIDAFNDVQNAKTDMNRLKNEAEAYRNDILPKARGKARRYKEDAAAYKAEVVNRAKGEAARFLSIYEEYKNAKSVTARRLYLETLEGVLENTDKVIIDSDTKGNQGVVPYLPLSATGGKK